MAFVFTPEDGTGLAGANSYASLEELADYVGGKLYADPYTAATDEQREKALVTASRLIDASVSFNGRRAGPTQGLEWPRSFVVSGGLPWGYPAGVGGSYVAQPFEGYLVPMRLKHATMELAIALLAGDRTADPETAGIAKLGLGQGAIELTFDKSDRPKVLPDVVRQLLEGLGTLYGTGGQRKVARA